MQERLNAEKREAAQLRARADHGKSQRQIAQAKKLKHAYENMRKFEAQRQQDRKEKEYLQKMTRKEKNREMAQKFQ